MLVLKKIGFSMVLVAYCQHTVDGRNPALPVIYETLSKMGYSDNWCRISSINSITHSSDIFSKKSCRKVRFT